MGRLLSEAEEEEADDDEKQEQAWLRKTRTALGFLLWPSEVAVAVI